MEKKLQELIKKEQDDSYQPQHKLARPIYPIEHINVYFKDPEYQKKYGIPHLGLQIEAKQ